jgi:hypothetical protein
MGKCNGITLKGTRCKKINCHLHNSITFRMSSGFFQNLMRYFNDRDFMILWVNRFDQTMEREEDVFITFRRLTGEDTSNFSHEMNSQFLRMFFDFKYNN